MPARDGPGEVLTEMAIAASASATSTCAKSIPGGRYHIVDDPEGFGVVLTVGAG